MQGKIRVLHLNINNCGGGAAEMFNSLCSAKSTLIENECITLESVDNRVRLLSRLSRLISFLILKIFSNASIVSNQTRSLNVINNNIVATINKLNPDVLHLHWVGGGVLNISSLSKVRAKVVWTLHDLWPLSGTHHCPVNMMSLHRLPRQGNLSNIADKIIESLTLRNKLRIYRSKEVTFVCPSHYIYNYTRKEFKGLSYIQPTLIQNGVDLEFWGKSPKDSEDKYYLNNDKVNVLCSFSRSPIIKGYDLFVRLLTSYPILSQTFNFFIVGAAPADWFAQYKGCTYLGFIDDPLTMRELIHRAKVTLVPSRFESFSLLTAQSLAANTPVIGFQETAVADLVKHKSTGYLAEKNNIDDLYAGLVYVNAQLHALCAWDKPTFSISSTINSYHDLYKKVTS